jgi:hypothetical protein
VDQPLAAFFASRQCPGAAIRVGLDWALEQARNRKVIISGFHSPLEQSVLKIVLEAGSLAVVMLARPVEGAKLPTAWYTSIDSGRLAIVGPIAGSGRLTEDLASDRNDAVATLAQELVIAHTNQEGRLEKQVQQWRCKNYTIRLLT